MAGSLAMQLPPPNVPICLSHVTKLGELDKSFSSLSIGQKEERGLLCSTPLMQEGYSHVKMRYLNGRFAVEGQILKKVTCA